jgi:hypothetical protein
VNADGARGALPELTCKFDAAAASHKQSIAGITLARNAVLLEQAAVLTERIRVIRHAVRTN